MTDRLHPSHETSDYTLDASETMEEQVLGLIEANVDHAQADRVRQLVHERFEELRAHDLGVDAAVATTMAVTGQPYAEPGTAAYRLNLIQSRIDRRDDAARKADETIGRLLDHVDRLELRSDALEARLLSLETKHG